jgi:hypothetical protein
MEPERPSRYPVLSQVQRQAVQVQRAEERLDAEWGPLRKLVTMVSVPVLALPLAALVFHILGDGRPEATSFVIGLGILAAVPLTANLVVRGIQAVLKRNVKTDPVWLEVLVKCAELHSVPEGVAGPLDRALDAYVTMRRMGGDPAWRRGGLPATDFVRHAGARMLELLEWGRRLKLVGARMEQLPKDAAFHPEHGETLAQYRLQCENLARAADLFSQAEAKMTRAYAALSSDQSLPSAAEDQFHEIAATFDALAELSAPSASLEGWSQTAPSASTTEQVARLHRGGSD